MAGWVPTAERHREIVAVLHEIREAEQAPPLLTYEEFRALPHADRQQHYYASWNPWKSRVAGESWQALLDVLADGGWHAYNAGRKAMVDTGIKWHTAYNLIWLGVRAGAIEEFRPGGSNKFTVRKIRLHENCPARLRSRQTV